MEAVKRITLKGSEIRPLLILAFEDLHWVDKSTEEYLKDFLESITGSKVFLIFTYRPEFVHTWGGKSYHSQVNLNRLSNRESLKMLTNLLGIKDIDRDLEELILEKTEGVPFFIEEFVRSLKDLKIIERVDSTYRLAKDLQAMVIPSTIQDVIMARVDSPPDPAKSVLQVGLVIEREFSYNLIKQVTGLRQRKDDIPPVPWKAISERESSAVDQFPANFRTNLYPHYFEMRKCGKNINVRIVASSLSSSENSFSFHTRKSYRSIGWERPKNLLLAEQTLKEGW